MVGNLTVRYLLTVLTPGSGLTGSLPVLPTPAWQPEGTAIAARRVGNSTLLVKSCPSMSGSIFTQYGAPVGSVHRVGMALSTTRPEKLLLATHLAMVAGQAVPR